METLTGQAKSFAGGTRNAAGEEQRAENDQQETGQGPVGLKPKDGFHHMTDAIHIGRPCRRSIGIEQEEIVEVIEGDQAEHHDPDGDGNAVSGELVVDDEMDRITEENHQDQPGEDTDEDRRSV